MLQLTALAIALQGIGYGAALTALQGLTAATLFALPEPAPAAAQAAVRPRRRVRRAIAVGLLRPSVDVATDEESRQREDEALLLTIGAL